MAVPASASAAITPSRDAGVVAGSMGSPSGASFTVIPPAPSQPAGIGTPSLAGFPTNKDTYALLSTGNVAAADQPNIGNASTPNNGGGGSHGPVVFDLVQLKVDFLVRGGANCASFDFRFLSEEFPTFVGSRFNDGFIAELDTSDFNASAAGIAAPHNFASDSAGHVISVNTTGFSAANAAGTTYNGATPLLRASTPVKPGLHSIYLSVFDQADSSLDSAAFLDNLRTFSSSGGCRRGAVPPPVAGKSFDAEPVSGTVFYKCRGSARQKLQNALNLPIGCVIDARNGRMRLTSAANRSSTTTKSAVFYSGQFKVKEKRTSRPVTELALAGKLAACPRRAKKRGARKSDGRDATDARRKRRKRGRRLWGKGKGRFRTRGRHSTATVRGTTWLVFDRCDGSTYTKVTSGKLTVRDLGKRKTIRLNAKRRRVYIARARRKH